MEKWHRRIQLQNKTGNNQTTNSNQDSLYVLQHLHVPLLSCLRICHELSAQVDQVYIFYKLHVMPNPHFDTDTITRVATIWDVAVVMNDKQSYI